MGINNPHVLTSYQEPGNYPLYYFNYNLNPAIVKTQSLLILCRQQAKKIPVAGKGNRNLHVNHQIKTYFLKAA